MQKRKENLFSNKFRLLNSQEHTEDIKWSSSESSDVENVSISCKMSKVNKVQRKRKRKKTGPKNVANLNITILNTSKELEEVKSCQKQSPTRRISNTNAFGNSPTFAPTQKYSRPQKCVKIEPSSPIFSCKPPIQSKIEKSPILLSKHNSPKVLRGSPKVRKRLFNIIQSNTQGNHEKVCCDISNNSYKKSEMLPECEPDRRKAKRSSINSNILVKDEKHSEGIFYDSKNFGNISANCGITKVKDDVKVKIEILDSQEQTEEKLNNNITLLKTPDVEVVQKTKSYFKNQFSSENNSQVSQHSISDCPTQKNNSKSSEDIEIISIATQINSKQNSFNSDRGILSRNPSFTSSQSAEFGTEKLKKIRYKKDGLAYRLNILLKKHHANVSLWQHERFLADNSNFLIPKGEHIVFLIQKVSFKYGSYLLESIDINDSNYLIHISSIYVQDCNIFENTVFKLYEPYKTFDYKENVKLIMNVCKFECLALSR